MISAAFLGGSLTSSMIGGRGLEEIPPTSFNTGPRISLNNRLHSKTIGLNKSDGSKYTYICTKALRDVVACIHMY